MTKILIIAPHSFCGNRRDVKRDCDLRARDVAYEMKKIAENAGYDVQLFESDVPRIIHDYNREKSYDTEWRQRIRDYINNNFGPIIIYEMHSFPNKDTEFNDSHMALVAIDKYGDEANELHSYLRNAGIKIHPAINNTRIVNLMVDTSKYKNIKHYLLEFNEDEKIIGKKETKLALLKIFFFSIKSFSNRSRLCIGVILVLLFLLFFSFFFSKISREFYKFTGMRGTVEASGFHPF